MNEPTTNPVIKATNKESEGWYAWFVVGVLSLAGIVSYIDRQVINLLVEPIKASLMISDTQISLVQGLSFALFYAVLAIPLARIADSGNRKHVITIGVIVWSVATFSCGLAVGFWSLFAARIFVGAGEATLSPAGYSMLGDYFSKERLPLAISIFTGSGFVGSGVALIIGAYVIDIVFAWGNVELPVIGEAEPWQMIFMLVALPSVFLVALMCFVKEPKRNIEPLRSNESETTNIPLKEVFAHLNDHRRIYIAMFFGFSFLASAQFSIGAWTPSFFIRTYNWSASQIGFWFGILAAVFSTAGVLTGGWLSSRLWQQGILGGNFIVPICATVLCIPLAILFPLIGSPEASLIVLALALFFGAASFGTGTATLPQIAPNRMRAQTVAIYLLIANLFGFSIGPTSVALVTDLIYADPKMLKYSLAIVAPLLMLLGALVVASGLPSYKKYLKNKN